MARALINSLTKDAVDYLNDSENVVIPTASGRNILLTSIGGFVITVIILFLTYDYRWSQMKLGILVFLIFVAAYLIVFAVWKWFVGRRRRVSPGLVVTRDYAIFVGDEDIEWLSISDLVNADYRHQFNGRNYEFSTLTLIYSHTARKFRVDGMELVESTVDSVLERKREGLIRASRSKNDAALDILETTLTTRSNVRLKTLILRVILTIVVGTLGTFGALQLNEHFHDSLSWQKALDTNTAGSYRQYLRTNADGRHRDDADGRLKSFYDSAESRYKASLKPGYDQEAVDSIVALLRYARETHEYQVNVSFDRSADIPEDLIERLKKEFDVKTVLPLGNTFTKERMVEREAELFGILNISFKQIFPDDVLELVSDCSSNCAVLNIGYRTSFLDSIYYDVKEKDIPEVDRNWSPGILIEWNCSLSISGQTSPYLFKLESAPAKHITYETDETLDADPKEADQKSFYDAMVSSSFDDFRMHLLFNLGLGPDPHPEQEGGREATDSMH